MTTCIGIPVVITEKLDGSNVMLHQGVASLRPVTSNSRQPWLDMVRKHHAWKAMDYPDIQRDLDDDYGAPDNNRLRHILTHNITGKFTNEYQTVLSNLHKEEDSEPFPESISMEFNPPEYQQIQQLITGYFNNRIDDIDDDIRAALDGNNHADLTATIGQLMKLEQETAAMREYSKTDFPPMDSPEERAELDALYDRYREQLLEALFKTANEHVTPERNFYRAFSAIDVNPIGSIDTKIQWDWIEANDPRANPDQESTQQRHE